MIFLILFLINKSESPNSNCVIIPADRHHRNLQEAVPGRVRPGGGGFQELAAGRGHHKARPGLQHDGQAGGERGDGQDRVLRGRQLEGRQPHQDMGSAGSYMSCAFVKHKKGCF